MAGADKTATPPGVEDALFALPPQPTSTSLDDYYLSRKQRYIVESGYDGPVRVLGASGTGKTVVALHRAKLLAETGHTVLLCSFNKNLARRMADQFSEICPSEYHARVRVADVGSVVGRTQSALIETGLLNPVQPVSSSMAQFLIESCPSVVQAEHLVTEWEDFIAPRAIWAKEEYLSLKRTGAMMAMGPAEREKYWAVYGSVRGKMLERGQYDRHSICRLLSERVSSWPDKLRFDAVLVDECQDLGLQELRFLLLLARDPRMFMVFGDSAQRILAPPQALSEAGIRCPGARTFVLDGGHRGTRQIAAIAAQALEGLPLEWDGVDYTPAAGHVEGEPVVTRSFQRPAEEEDYVLGEIRRLHQEKTAGIVGVLVPTITAGVRLQTKLRLLNVPICQVGCGRETDVQACAAPLYWQSYNSAKGMEFDTCVLPSFSTSSLRSGIVGSRSAQRDRMRLAMLAHVLLSRARRRLVVTWSGSSVLDELAGRA